MSAGRKVYPTHSPIYPEARYSVLLQLAAIPLLLHLIIGPFSPSLESRQSPVARILLVLGHQIGLGHQCFC